MSMDTLICKHDIQWNLKQNVNDKRYCIACSVELLESGDCPLIKKDHILREMTEKLKNETSRFLFVLQENEKVVNHFCAVVIGATQQLHDSDVVALVHELLAILIRGLGGDVHVIVMKHIISKCYSVPVHNHLHPILLLLLRLSEFNPSISERFLLNEDSFINFLVSAIDFPDKDLRLVILQLCEHLLQCVLNSAEDSPELSSLGANLIFLPAKIISLISSNDNTVILLQCIQIIIVACAGQDFLRWLTGDTVSTRDDVSVKAVITEVLAGLKRLLLRREDSLNLKVIQCLMVMLGHHSEMILEPFLNADLAEFIYDTLRSTTSPQLISTIYCCILLLAESDTFHLNCHAMYGLESVLRSLNELLQTSQSVISSQGIILIRVILERQPEHVSVLKTLSLFDRTVEVIKDGLSNKHPDVVISATQTASALLKHFPCVFPVSEVTSILNTMNAKLIPIISLMSGRKQDTQGKPMDADLVDISTDDCLNSRSASLRNMCAAAWDVFCHASLLVVQNQPTVSSNPSDLLPLRDLIVTSIEETWLTTTTKTLDALSSPTVILSMINTLTVVCQSFCTKSLLTKLIKGVFIRLCLTIKSRFSNDRRHSELIKFCVRFLLHLSCAGLTEALESPSERLQSLLSNGFLQIEGKVSDCIHFLSERNVLANESLLSIQCAVTTLLFNSFWYGGRDTIAIPNLKSSLDTFCMLHDSLHHVPSSTKQQMLFLYAVCQMDASTSTDVPIHLIPTEGKMQHIHHPIFVSFVVALEPTESRILQLQDSVVKNWILLGCSNPKDETSNELSPESELLVHLCKHSERTSTVLLRLLITSEEEPVVSDTLLEIIFVAYKYHYKQAIENDQHIPLLSFCEGVKKSLYEHSYSRLAKSGSIPPSKLHTLLRLLLLVNQSDTKEEMETHSFLLRILKLLLELISDKSSDSSVIVPSLRLIEVIILNNTHENQRISVLSAIFSQKSFLQRLFRWAFGKSSSQNIMSVEHGYKDLAIPAALDILALLISMQNVHKIPISCVFKIPIDCLAQFTCNSCCRGIRSSCLNLWTAVFETRFSRDFVVFERINENAPSDLVHGDDIDLLRIDNLRAIWNQTLNQTASPCERDKKIAFRCALAIFRYIHEVSGREDVKSYIVNHPWLDVVLMNCPEDASESDEMPNSPSWITSRKELYDLRRQIFFAPSSLDEMPDARELFQCNEGNDFSDILLTDDVLY